jgi:hypothetical protein
MTSLYEFQSNLITGITVITYFLYIVIALGLSANAPRYLNDLVYYTKIYVGLFLVVRFNPFTRVKFTPLDARIAFNAGMFLLFATVLNGILHKYIAIIKPHTQKIGQEIKERV